jgi:hypothetical protein
MDFTNSSIQHAWLLGFYHRQICNGRNTSTSAPPILVQHNRAIDTGRKTKANECVCVCVCVCESAREREEARIDAWVASGREWKLNGVWSSTHLLPDHIRMRVWCGQRICPSQPGVARPSLEAGREAPAHQRHATDPQGSKEEPPPTNAGRSGARRCPHRVAPCLRTQPVGFQTAQKKQILLEQ